MWAQVLFNGATSGMFYVLMALGFTLIFGIMRLVNFAHSEFYMLGGFAVYHLSGAFGLPYFAALGLGALLVSAFGVVCERLVFAPLRGRELSMLISALGLQIALRGAVEIAEGSDSVPLASPLPGVWRLGSLVLPHERLLVIGLGAALVLAMLGLIHRTGFGRRLRATAQDTEAAAMQGIAVERVYMQTFALGCGLAALAGGLIAPIFSLTADMGEPALLKAFIVVILGGLGSVAGAVVGGLGLGLGENLLGAWFGNVAADMLGFALIMVVLLLRPQGLLGKSGR